jgi:Domain of unknown function (DUF5671)
MAATDELTGFVRDSLGRGIGRADIAGALRRAGWNTGQIQTALHGYAEVEFPVPVPRPRPYLDAREAFLYLVLFGTLYTTAINLGTLLFQLIDRAFPDPAAPAVGLQFAQSAIRWSISSIVVALPVFVWTSRITARGVREDPVKRASKVRRWLTYLTMFVASSVLIGDLITLVNSLLSGGLTSRFVFKVLTVTVIAGAVLGYYLLGLRADEQEVQA